MLVVTHFRFSALWSPPAISRPALRGAVVSDTIAWLLVCLLSMHSSPGIRAPNRFRGCYTLWYCAIRFGPLWSTQYLHARNTHLNRQFSPLGISLLISWMVVAPTQRLSFCVVCLTCCCFIQFWTRCILTAFFYSDLD